MRRKKDIKKCSKNHFVYESSYIYAQVPFLLIKCITLSFDNMLHIIRDKIQAFGWKHLIYCRYSSDVNLYLVIVPFKSR